jgi:hypothetical protein
MMKSATEHEIDAELASLSVDMIRLHRELRDLESDIARAKATKMTPEVARAEAQFTVVKEKLAQMSKRQALIEMKYRSAVAEPPKLN